MSEPLVEVSLKGVIPTPGGAAVFLASEAKVITLFVDAAVASAILMAMNGETAPRPLTHDLMLSSFEGLGVEVSSVVINDFTGETYYARLHLSQESEVGSHLVEIDGRPSDCIALAARTGAPIYVSRKVWEDADDMSAMLDKLREDAEEGDEEDEGDGEQGLH